MFKVLATAQGKRQSAAFHQVLSQLGLLTFWSQIEKTNPAVNAPYHSNQHMYHVARIAYELYCLDHVNAGTYNKDHARNIVVAGLVHDYDHSMGRFVDSVNIERVLRSIEWWGMEHPGLCDWDEVADLVRSTQFPYVEYNYPPLHPYLRDADLMYGMEIHAQQGLLKGLPEEIAQGSGTQMTSVQFLPLQRKFLDGIEPTSRPAQFIWRACLEEAFYMQSKMAEYFDKK
jgi:hypothetical protein